MNNRLMIPVAALLLAPALCDCSGHGGRQSLPDLSGLPAYVADVSITVYDNDSAAFASLVQYPLSRPYPLHDIADSADMVAYYPVMVDDSLRSAVSGDNGWEQYGWRGWALADGMVWVDEDGIYDIPYMSAAEKKHYDELVDREMATLPAAMRPGYMPLACYRAADGPAVYRVDLLEGTDSCRLAVYGKGARANAAPDIVLPGRRMREGSGMYTSYEFAGPAMRALMLADPATGDTGPTLTLTGRRGSADIALTPVYWLESLK